VCAVLDPLKYPAKALIDAGENGIPLLRQVLALVTPGAWAVLILPLALVVAAIVLEASNHALSRALVALDDRKSMFLLVALLVWFGHSYLIAGYLLAGDAGSHVARTAHLRMGLEEGRLIDWDNYFYIGETALQFTGPLYFWLTAAVDYAVRDPNLTTKLTIFALHVFSGLAFYGLSRTIGLARVAALGATIAWSGSFAHLHLFIWEGAFPQALTFALLPLAFWTAERVLRERVWFSRAWLALTTTDAALLVTHQTTGAYLAIFVAVFVLASLVSGRAPWSRLATLVLSAVTSICVTAFAIVPILLEKEWVMLYDAVGAPFHLHWPGVDYFRQLITWSNGDARGAPATYVGLSAIALAGFGMWRGLLLRDPEVNPRLVGILSLVVGLAIVLRGAHVRHMIALLFGIALLAGVGIQVAATRAQSRRVSLWVLAALLIDLGPTAIQPLARTDKGYFDVAGKFLESHFPQERVLLTRDRAGTVEAPIGPGGPPLLYHRVQFLTGAHNLAATRSHNYLAASIKLVESDLRNHGMPDRTSGALLSMLNVGHIINDSGSALGLPGAPGAAGSGPLGNAIRLVNGSPVLFASALSEVEPDPGLDKPVLWNEQFAPGSTDRQATEVLDFVRGVVQAMDIDTAIHSARFLPVRALPTGSSRSESGDPGWGGSVEQYRVGFEEIRLTLHSDRKGWIQAAHPYYPTVTVSRNGDPVSPYQGAFNLLVLPVDAGRNNYVIRYRTSTLRKAMAWISAATLGIAVTMTAVAALRRRSWRHSNPHNLLE
jgi:hypothetical protein